jgi:hypothetical protein
MTTTLAKKTEVKLARPIGVLAPLIRADVRDGDIAGMKFYLRAGEKLIEAKAGEELKHGEFENWACEVTDRSQQTWTDWMRAARNQKKSKAVQFKSIRQAVGGHRASVGAKGNYRAWHDPVKKIASEVKSDVKRVDFTEIDRKQEVREEQKLALRLIDIGYKVLAVELHPDKGGSKEVMTRLNVVRDNLKACANEWD